jgi:hypothetical protein
VTRSQVEIEGLKQTQGRPISLALDNLTLHNHSRFPPLGLCISAAPGIGALSTGGGGAGGKGGGIGCAQLRSMEERIMNRLVSLEQSLSFGPLATLQVLVS